MVFVFYRRISYNSRNYSSYKWHSTVGVCINPSLGVVSKCTTVTRSEFPHDPRVLWNESMAFTCIYLHIVLDTQETYVSWLQSNRILLWRTAKLDRRRVIFLTGRRPFCSGHRGTQGRNLWQVPDYVISSQDRRQPPLHSGATSFLLMAIQIHHSVEWISRNYHSR